MTNYHPDAVALYAALAARYHQMVEVVAGINAKDPDRRTLDERLRLIRVSAKAARLMPDLLDLLTDIHDAVTLCDWENN